MCLEARLGQHIPVQHVLIPWLLQHTCTLFNARSRGSDGLTTCERVKGRAFNQLVLGFAECVLHKLPTKGPQSRPDGNMGTRWLEGVFLGFNRSSNTYIVATEDGVVSRRTLYRKPIENRWMAGRVLQFKSTPWSLRERAQPQPETRETTTRTEPKIHRREGPLPKAFRIIHAEPQEHGLSEDCPQC